MAFIGIGSVSKYYIYIILAAAVKLLLASLLGLSPSNVNHPGALLNFLPILRNHIIFQNFLEFVGYVIGAFLVYFLFININKTISITGKKDLDLANSSNNDDKGIYLSIIIVANCFAISIILRSFVYLNFGNLDFWMIEFLLIYFFTRIIFKTITKKHQKLLCIC